MEGLASHRGAVLWTFGLCHLKSVVFRNKVSIRETPKALQTMRGGEEHGHWYQSMLAALAHAERRT